MADFPVFWSAGPKGYIGSHPWGPDRFRGVKRYQRVLRARKRVTGIGVWGVFVGLPGETLAVLVGVLAVSAILRYPVHYIVCPIGIISWNLISLGNQFTVQPHVLLLSFIRWYWNCSWIGSGSFRSGISGD